jgi:hypothetical protein
MKGNEKNNNEPADNVMEAKVRNATQIVPTEQFDLENLRLSQDFGSFVPVKKIISNVPVKKPHRQQFIYIHPDLAMRMEVRIIEIVEDHECYLVAKQMAEEMSGEWVPKILVPYITRQGTVCLWPVKLPDSTGRLDSWNKSALEIIREYCGRWIKIESNHESGGYDVVLPSGNFPEPTWPDESFESFLKKAFKGKVINNIDHQILKRLRGEI